MSKAKSRKSRRQSAENEWSRRSPAITDDSDSAGLEPNGVPRRSGRDEVMVAADLLRLAWEAEHDGRSKLRDALMTFAVTESRPEDTWAERCRARLLQDRPDHFLSQFATVAEALGDPRVIDARDRLRAKYPPARVQSLQLRASTRRGTYLGRVESLEAMIEDLVGFTPAEADHIRLDIPQPSRGPMIRHRVARTVAWSLSYPPLERSATSTPINAEPEPPSDWDKAEPPESIDPDIVVFYATVLLAIAFLFAAVEQSRSSG